MDTPLTTEALILVEDEHGFVTLHEPNEDGAPGDLVASVWRDDWLSRLQACSAIEVVALDTDTARLALWQAIDAITIGNKHDDKLIIANLAKAGVYLAKIGGGK